MKMMDDVYEGKRGGKRLRSGVKRKRVMTPKARCTPLHGSAGSKEGEYEVKSLRSWMWLTYCTLSELSAGEISW
jgi:hypothetical protein